MSTRAIKFLKQKGVLFNVVEYDHKQKGAKFAAEAINFPLGKTIKTLVADLGLKGHALVLMPGDKNLSPKKLANAFGVKRTAMADSASAQRLTGYLVGGISPFGTKRKLPAIMEKCLLKADTVAINAGQRGVMLVLKPEDIVQVLNAMTEDLAE
jgi:Cys-tRNA(Pro)/Cys-tRNA(Cys) deacylase